LAKLDVPLSTQIRSYDEKFTEGNRLVSEKKNVIEEQQREIQAHQEALQALNRFGALPSEDALQHARQHRDHGWEMVLAEWKGKGTNDVLVEGIPLEKAFPQTILQADDIADRLRKDASAVAEAQEKQRQIKACEERIQNARTELEVTEKAIAAHRGEWEALWARHGVSSGTPAHMQEWREGWLNLYNAVAKQNDATQLLSEKEKKVIQARKKLAEALGESAEKSFNVLFNAAKQKVQQGEQAHGVRKEIQQNLNKQRFELAGKRKQTECLKEKASQAEADWKLHATELGLEEATSAEPALSLLQERRDLVNIFDQWTDSEKEANRLRDALAKYTGQVQAQALKFKIPASETPTQVGHLWRLFSAHYDVWKERERLKTERSQLETELNNALLQMQQAGQRVENLLQEARLQTADQLRPLISRLERQTRINSDLRRLRATLTSLARSEQTDAFVARVRQEAPETFPQRQEQLRLELEDCERMLDDIESEIRNLSDQRDSMEKAGDQSAGLKQQAENQAASLRDHAARYIRLQLAIDVLRKQVERFRQRNQGPLLEKSGAAFRLMTQGAFTTLAADFNEKDTPILVGCRANGSRVPIEGMSEGTRDQLFLALRFASLDLHLQTHEPMPLILDDLLITFDNRRTKAVLPELAKLAGRTQVFLFTHHEHLIDLCHEALGERGFALHRLGAD